MADDLDFRKNVPGVANTPNTPVLKRQVSAEPSTYVPDFGDATRKLAESQNLLSDIGAKVAQSANTQMATQLGYEQGKTPSGDLMPAFTEFDQNFEKSYNTQANATLSLQGEKLLNDAEIEMAKPNRLSPDLIAKTTNQLNIGLSKIAEQAPTAIKGTLQNAFSSQVLQQNTQYQKKMISQQREDEKNNLDAALVLNTKNASELAMNGDYKGAENAAATAKTMAENGVANRYLTPAEAMVHADSAKQAAINGRYTHQAIIARDHGLLPEFEKNFASKKPEGLTNEQWFSAGQAFKQHIDFLDSLRKQDENIKAAQFHESVLQNVNGITGSQIAELKANVDPLTFEQEHITYLRALKASQKTNAALDSLDFTNPSSMASASTEVRNAKFNQLVDSHMQKQQAAGLPINRDDAEVTIAASAGGSIPVFHEALENKLRSSNPNYIESAGQQVERLKAMGAGNVIDNLSDHAKAMLVKYDTLRDSMDPNTAAKMAHEIVYDQKVEVQQANEMMWSKMVSKKIAKGQSQIDFALKASLINKDNLLVPGLSTIYGNDILDQYKTFYTILNGDDVSARKMLQESVKNNYGQTTINGRSETTKHPIEKVLNLPEDATPVVQQDIINQLNNNFTKNKADFDAGHVNEYWVVTPRITPEEAATAKQKAIQKGFEFSEEHWGINNKFNKAEPIEVTRHLRSGKTEKYQVVIQANPFATLTGNKDKPIEGGWDIALNSDSGMRNLTRIAPYLGLMSYNPDTAYIRSTYTKLHPLH